MAKDALRRGGNAPAILNAANEIAVEAFLDRRLGFLDIPSVVARTLERAEAAGLIGPTQTLDDVLQADAEGRRLARSVIESPR
jgi:1-deoxy-D-xylulose-5-phosphate reductoisomerase